MGSKARPQKGECALPCPTWSLSCQRNRSPSLETRRPKPSRGHRVASLLWNILNRAKCSGCTPRVPLGWGGPSAICSRPIFDSPESNSSVSDDDTPPPSSHPIRQPADSRRRQISQIETWDRIAPGGGVCSLGPPRARRLVGWLAAPTVMHSVLPSLLFYFPSPSSDKTNEYGRTSHPPAPAHMQLRMHMQTDPWPQRTSDQSRMISSASMQR